MKFDGSIDNSMLHGLFKIYQIPLWERDNQTMLQHVFNSFGLNSKVKKNHKLLKN